MIAHIDITSPGASCGGDIISSVSSMIEVEGTTLADECIAPPTPPPPPIAPCMDEPSDWMVSNNLACTTWTYIKNYCNKNNLWIE